jgi:hypothetical protein
MLRIATIAVVCLLLGPGAPALSDASDESGALAVIVHPDNPVRNVRFSELCGYLKLDKQYWPKRAGLVTLYLPPRDSTEKAVLLERIYRMTDRDLGKYWRRKMYAGEIKYVPGRGDPRLVATSKNAVTVVLSDRVPAGVRVLTIDGKKPGESGYPLVATSE